MFIITSLWLIYKRRWNFVLLTPFIHFIHLPLATINLFIAASFFCLFVFNSTYKWAHMVFVFLGLKSLYVMLSESIHIVTSGKISFFFMDK